MAEFTKTITETVNCPGCGHNQVIKNGNQAGQQRYQCKACKKQFRANGKSTGRRIPDEQAGGAVRMYFGGMSYKQIGETMADLYDIPEPSKASVYEWVTDFGQQAVKEMAKHPAQVGDTWVADEMMVQVGGEKYWNWNVMDEDTRYILASYLSKNRDTAAARAVMRKAKANSAVTPTEIKTDKWRAYLRAIREEFPDTKHVQSQGLTAEVNNNRSERLQGTFRQRTKTLRGLEHRESGQRYLDGWVLDYNLFREHEGLGGRTPGEAAKVNAPFQEWADVVRADLANRPANSPKAPPQQIVPVVQVVDMSPARQRESGRPERVKVTGQRRLPPSPVRRQFKSAAGSGRPDKPRNPAWLRRGEVRGRY